MSKYLVGLLIAIFSLGFFSGFSQPQNQFDLNIAIENCVLGETRSKYINCIYNELSKNNNRQSTKELMASLESITLTNTLFKKNPTLCHDVSHAIGQFASKSGVEIGTALSECSVICTAGCYHGVVEGYVAIIGELNDELMSVCKPDIFEADLQHGACLHGLGHGIASLLGSDVMSALKMCDQLREEERPSCGAGVLMELYEPGSFDHARLTYPENILDQCNAFWGVYKNTCERTAGAHELSRSGSYQSAIEVCNSLSEPTRSECARELGAHFYHSSNWLDEQGVLRCNQFEKDSRISCLEGIIFASKNADPSQVTAKEICRTHKDIMGDVCIL